MILCNNPCRCGGAGVDIDRFGEGVCETVCPGDSTFLCGGAMAYNAYEIGACHTHPPSSVAVVWRL